MNTQLATDDRRQADIQTKSVWSVAIIAARESIATLEEVVRAVIVASTGHAVRIDVLVNGNRDLADGLARRFELTPIAGGGELTLIVWAIKVGDKAQTWNTYVHRVYQGAEVTFFIDGYAHPRADALEELATALRDDGEALAATGVPTYGRSAGKQWKDMQRLGGIHGNLFAVTNRTMAEFRRRGFRLPMGLYRTDSLIGAAINFRFDPANNDWNPALIRVQPSATWYFEALKWWRFGDIKTHFKRVKRQAQGHLENLAVRDHLAQRRQAPESLPKTARELVLQWWHGENGPRWYRFFQHPTWFFAIRRFHEVRDWSDADLAPESVFRHDGSQAKKDLSLKPIVR